MDIGNVRMITFKVLNVISYALPVIIKLKQGEDASADEVFVIGKEKVYRASISLLLTGVNLMIGPQRQCEPNGSFTTVAPKYEQICPLLTNTKEGEWTCDNEARVGSVCKLNCALGFHVTGRGNTRRCRCSDKRQACYWTRHELECVASGPKIEIWETSDYDKDSIENERCPLLYETDSGSNDEFKNGNWLCQVKNRSIHHNELGTKCELVCDSGFEVIQDGKIRKCRFNLATDTLQV